MIEEKIRPRAQKKICTQEATKKNGDDKDSKNVRNGKRGDEY